MNILIIPSAKLINEELQGRYGKIVPVLIPLENGVVLDKLYREYESYYEEIVLTLHEEVENTLKIINLRNYPKLKIKVLSRLSDIGNGIKEVLSDYKELEKIQNVSINFGDIYLENIKQYLNKNIVCYCKNSETDRWAFLENKDDKLMIKQQNPKEKVKNDEKNILIGFFNIIFIKEFHKILLEKKEENKESLYQALEEYDKLSKMNLVLENEWSDFGHLDNFLQVQKIVETRFFNEIVIDKDRNILTKKSEEREKLINEIKWFLTLPNELQWIIPRIYSYSLEWKEPKVSMEYYSYPTLHHLYLYGNHNIDKWKQIFNKLFYVHEEMRKYSLKLESEIIVKALNKIYEEKTFERLEKLKKDKNFINYFEQDFYINNHKIKSLTKLSKIIKKLIIDLKINEKEELNIIHGDYFFANILYDPIADIVKLIDPRGDFGGYGIYGDSNYDLAKLAHSVDGKYDFIVEDLFELEELKNGFNYKIVYSENHEKIKELFYSYFDKKQKIKIKFIQALLFLSMIPLHKDKPQRQKVMLGVGIRILYEIIEERGIEII
jgi:serine/threonine protein kinase